MLYFVQQRMVAARAAVSPTMSPTQQKLMQYLPVVFAVFQVFFLPGLVIYYIAQTVLRIAQQIYITRRFYGQTSRSAARRSGPASRPASWPRQDGGGGDGSARPSASCGAGKGEQAPTSGSTGAPRARTAPASSTAPPAGADDVEAHDTAEEPPDADRGQAGRRPARPPSTSPEGRTGKSARQRAGR